MAYENIKKLVSNSIKKIVFTWILFFSLVIGVLFFYNIENQTIQFINDQVLAISEINTEITSVLYYNSQKNIANDIDFDKTLLNQWITLNKNKYTNIIPKSIPEVNYLNELGTIFYSKKILKDKDATILAYQNLSDQLSLLQRISFSYIDNSLSKVLKPLLPFLLIGFLFIAVVLSFLFANGLQKKLILKNEFILEDIWNELQGIELAEEEQDSYLTNQHTQTNEIETIYYPGTEQIHSLIKSAKELASNILMTKDQLLHSIPETNSSISVTQQNKEHTDISEKIVFIQKLLSRLFTRAERAAALAKATAENGFQAGILALNISIEAARTGENGKNFIPMSDRVKDFAEKSNQIGKAILEELKDVDLSIRKAYAMSKGILEEVSNQPNPSSEELTTTKPEYSHYIQDIIVNFDNMFELSQYIQNISSNLETTIDVPKSAVFSLDHTHANKKDLFLKEILIRSFERLYRFNYGIDPPHTPFSEER